jgi:glycerol-3-phosphate dehydrogenase
VINQIQLKGWTPKPIKRSPLEDKTLEGKHVDVLVIGGGVVGCAILRELSRYKLSALLVEKEEDLAMGASSRNDGCVHVGIDLDKNSAKLHYLLRSRAIYAKLCEDLDVPYREDGQSVAFKSLTLKGFAAPYLREKARKNHIPGGVKILNREEMLKIEPHLAEGIKWGAYFPGGACVSPYELTIALGENAVSNGAEVSFNTLVESMEVKDHQILSVKTNRGTIYPKVVVNAAGVYSDVIANMAEDQFFTIHPRKGTDSIMDKAVTSSLSKTAITVYPKLGEEKKTHSKGGGLIPTIDKNILVGPDAVEIPDREDYTTSKSSIDTIYGKHVTTIASSFGARHHHLFLGDSGRDLRRGFHRPKRQMDQEHPSCGWHPIPRRDCGARHRRRHRSLGRRNAQGGPQGSLRRHPKRGREDPLPLE